MIHSDETDSIWTVRFDCYFDGDSSISPRAKDACRKVLLRKRWVLDQTGYFLNISEECLERKFVIDLTSGGEDTVRFMSMFPYIAARKIGHGDASELRLPIYMLGDSGWSDHLRFDISAELFYLERLSEHWDKHVRGMSKLGKEIREISRKIP